MDDLITENLPIARGIVREQAAKWYLPRDDYEDILQEVLLRTVQGWKGSKDPKAHLVSLFYLNTHTTILRLMGYHNGKKRPRQPKVLVQLNTEPVGLIHRVDGGDDMVIDERILPTVASAEDVYMAKLPTRRQVALREAIDGLPEPQRTAMREQVYEELSVAESASSMGISNVQVSLLRSSGTAMLKRRMGSNG